MRTAALLSFPNAGHAQFTIWFVASIVAGCRETTQPKATQLVLASTPSAVAETMAPLATQPVVQVADASGPPSTGTTVTAQVVSGSGDVVAGGSVTTDAAGRASFSNLTLGAVRGAVGPLTIQFSAPGLTPVIATVELRCAIVPFSIGPTVSRALTTGDCTAPRGGYKNIFEGTTSQPATAVRLTLVQGLIRPFLGIRGPDEPKSYWGWSATAGGSISFKALLPAGRNQVEVSTTDAGETGDYSLTVAAASEDLTCDDDLAPVAASPIITTQRLGTDDCVSDSFLEDAVLVGLPANASITASMTSAAFQPRIRLAAYNGGEVATATAPGTATLTFANASGAANLYYLILTSQARGSTGDYTLSLKITYP
jgi:hypothetical protein